MKQAILKKGVVYPQSTPAPNASNGNILVKIASSCISAGTEMSGVKSSGTNIIQRALKQPENVKKVLDAIKSDGLKKTFTKVKSKLDGGSALGYSASGVIIDLGTGVEGFKVGDEVAIAGVGYANHAEYAEVPKNLVVKKPKGITFNEASSVALGAIAMQGTRRAALTLGESCVVVGAGILGLLTLQMLKASGIRVCVLDLDEGRLNIANELGAEMTLNPSRDNSVSDVVNWAGGRGVDCVIFTAATSSSGPLSDAFKMCRIKGTVILVGVSGMEINRADIYKKELDFKVSTSYGPGRYDVEYEEKGHDYPYAYVRWTEQRNMQEYLRLIDIQAIKLDRLIDATYKIDNVTNAYESLKIETQRPLMVILTYGEPEIFEQTDINRRIDITSYVEKSASNKIIKFALVGAGSFATGMHLPNIKELSDRFKLHAVCNRSGHKATSVAELFGAKYATTNIDDVLGDAEIELVLIATRHDSHGELVLKALEAGKHVFVEKPLATTQEQLDKIKHFYHDGIEGKPILFVGFNRRFSKYAQEINKFTQKRINPLFATYRMNAGHAPSDSWIHDDGGRIVGEGCHIIDLMNFITGSKLESLTVQSLTPVNSNFSSSDNKSIALKYVDGSVCVVNYFSVGNKGFAKENLEVHFDGKTIVMDDYISLRGYGVKLKEIKTASSEKGQKEELIFLYDSLSGKNPHWPIEYSDLIQTTEATFISVADKG
ncbi:MAG: oxidoreductase [Gammaproteobacteria bacterium]|nr:MAG: oxidoreductase [Gammaproteobacteria bacterium]